MANTVFITGIHTGAGKTLVAASLTLLTNGTYWKPIQTGHEQDRDDSLVKQWLEDTQCRIHPTEYCFSLPASPNIAAAAESAEILPEKINVPNNQYQTLIIEGAGGFLVPLNQTTLYGDWIASLKIPVIIVINSYLGCINHTLLTIEVVKNRISTPIKLIFCGDFQPEVIQTISHFAKLPVIGQIPFLENPTPQTVVKNNWLQIPTFLSPKNPINLLT